MPADQYTYDDLGNVTSKSDYASGYTYGTSRITSAAGPHAVVSLSTGATFTYDENGNLTHGDGRDVTFDSLDRPITVTMGGVTTQFRYAPDGARYLRRTTGILTGPYATKTVYYVDKDYERVAWSSSVVEEKTYIGTSVVIERSGTTQDVRYLHLDRLGSTDAVTNSGAFCPAECSGGARRRSQEQLLGGVTAAAALATALFALPAAQELRGPIAVRAAEAIAAREAATTVTEGGKVFRVWGDEAKAWDRSWITVDPRTVPDYRNVAGLPSGNTGRFLSEGILENTQGVATRPPLPLHGNMGGLPEVVVPKPTQQIKLLNVQGLNPPF
jgi:hypothetical protein